MEKTALLVMDVQNGIVARFAAADALQPLQAALQTARARSLSVIFVRVAFRPGYPEVSPDNRAFSSIKERGGMLESDDATQVWDGVRPAPDEVIVIKRRVSAFTASGLEVILRAQGIEHLILTGIATSGVVLSTLREAADKVSAHSAVRCMSGCRPRGTSGAHGESVPASGAGAECTRVAGGAEPNRRHTGLTDASQIPGRARARHTLVRARCRVLWILSPY